MKLCRKCDTDLIDSNWSRGKQERANYICNPCHNATWTNNPNRKKRDAVHNANQLFINGEYIKKSDPRRDIYKPGRWVLIGDKLFEKKQEDAGIAGYLYAVTNPAWPDWIKLGKATNPEKRIGGYQTSSPMRDYEVLFTIPVDNMSKAEKALHKTAAKHNERQHEWFKLTPQQAIELLKDFSQ